MKNHTPLLATVLFFCFSALITTGITQSAFAGQAAKADKKHALPGMIHGKVTDVIDVPSYTYAEVNTGTDKIWAAGPITPLKVGDTIAFSMGMPIHNYKSKSMDRTFDLIYFVTSFITDKDMSANKTPDLSSPHSQLSQKPTSAPVTGIDKVKGGNTIAEIHSNKSALNGKTVRVRGKVTKYNAKIMGKNWLHIQDSSGTGDLTVTTKGEVKVGDVVVVEGKLMLNKDYGYGYVYPVILEDASITK